LVHQLKPSSLVVAAQQALAVLVDAAHTRQRSEKLRTNAAGLQHRNLQQEQLAQLTRQQCASRLQMPVLAMQRS
jgi:preprotein translocase subunit Sec61beta